jgi:hypothetical protein
MLVEDISRNKCFFFRYQYHIFHVIYPFVIYLLTLSSILRACVSQELSVRWSHVSVINETRPNKLSFNLHFFT